MKAAVIANRHAHANTNDCDGNTLRRRRGARQSSSSQRQQQQHPLKSFLPRRLLTISNTHRTITAAVIPVMARESIVINHVE
mmetsp:Transcript_34558/g.42268  ORF Transcript_34558/g.42268 Transcript_34558/m.42268 type:complete len:82 (+) Transcript_34558:416-661(+)